MIVRKVGKLMVLPVGQPQMVVVQDANQIKAQQLFFKNAENGDIVLVYADTAILYSPTRNKIINVGPVINENKADTVVAEKKEFAPATTSTPQKK
jgi:hypothetical protein